ncbi:PHP domain-containing protein [Candidatus Woesearchaeota archaeon]|nr:PHP domain-containing protein [Candidatus Woesearchaeota archaeon]
MLKSDFHAHTNYIIHKYDSKLTPKQLINFTASKGYEVLAITEHSAFGSLLGSTKFFKNPIKTYFDFKDYAKKKRILLIPGVEAFIEKKEILLINFKGNLDNIKTFEDIEKLKDENAVIIAPHPYYGKPSCLGNKLIDYIRLFDAIEHCHFYLPFFNPNKKAIEIAKKYKKPLVANSDAHNFNQIGSNYTLVDADKNVDSILEAVRKNKLRIVTKPLSIPDFASILAWSLVGSINKKIV